MGAVVGITLAVILGLSLLGGSSLNTARYVDERVSFSVEMPADWENSIVAVSSLELVRAVPVDAPDGDATSVSISRSDLRGLSAQEYNELVDTRVGNIEDSEQQAEFGYKVGEVSVSEFGSEASPSFRIDYQQTEDETNIVYNVTTFYIYEEGTGFEITSNAVYSEQYSALGSTIEKITESYQPN